MAFPSGSEGMSARKADESRALYMSVERPYGTPVHFGAVTGALKTQHKIVIGARIGRFGGFGEKRVFGGRKAQHSVVIGVRK